MLTRELSVTVQARCHANQLFYQWSKITLEGIPYPGKNKSLVLWLIYQISENIQFYRKSKLCWENNVQLILMERRAQSAHYEMVLTGHYQRCIR